MPRPETELLAGWAIERAAAPLDATAVVVDLCTGSGAIAQAVADEVPDAEVHAVELDEGALAWAERNLAGTGVDLRHGDLATAFDDLRGTVDVVVCNPPYIPLEAWESVAAEARDHDPHLALFSGQDGLDAIRVLEQRAALLLRPGGVVGAEHADVQGESAPGVFAATGRWHDVADHRDLAGRPRYRDRATGTMSAVDRLATSTEEEREAAVTAAAAAVRRGRAGGDPDRHRLRHRRRRVLPRRRQGACSRPRAAAATCRRRCWSRRPPRSTRWPRACPRGHAPSSSSSGPAR